MTHLIKVEDQVQLTHIPKELIQHLNKEVNSLEICQRVVIGVDTGAEEEARVTSVDDFGRSAEFDKVGLVFLIARCYETVHFSFELDLVVVGIRAVPFG